MKISQCSASIHQAQSQCPLAVIRPELPYQMIARTQAKSNIHDAEVVVDRRNHLHRLRDSVTQCESVRG